MVSDYSLPFLERVRTLRSGRHDTSVVCAVFPLQFHCLGIDGRPLNISDLRCGGIEMCHSHRETKLHFARNRRHEMLSLLQTVGFDEIRSRVGLHSASCVHRILAGSYPKRLAIAPITVHLEPFHTNRHILTRVPLPEL